MDSDGIDAVEDIHDLQDEEREMYEHFRMVVDRGQTPVRIDRFLTDRLPNVSRNRIQNAARADCILCGNKPVKPNYKVKPGEVISIVLPHPPVSYETLPEDIPLKVVYEDDKLLVIDKQAGLVVHPGYNNYTGTLINALLYHYEKCDHSEAQPLLVHRIDKDTSGLMVVAKEEYAQTFLARQFFEHSIKRVYHAMVWGDIDSDKGTITGFLARSTRDRRMVAVYDSESEGKWSVTHFSVLERFGFATLVECRLETGRTHQIRAHMKHIGHPLFSDEMYGGKALLKGNPTTKFRQFIDNCFAIMPRQALHAAVLGFVHPNGQPLYFESSLPEDFQSLLDKFRKATGTK